MNQKVETRFVSIMKAFSDYSVSNKLVSLGNSIELLALCRKFAWRLARACSLNTVNLSKRSTQAYNFCKYILIMRRYNGVDYTVNYLKASQLAIQKKIGKDKIESLRDLVPGLPLPRLTRSGLPKYIPLRDRRAICSSSPSVIRWWLTLYSIYRVLEAPSKLKLETITNVFSGSQEFLDQVSEGLGRLARVHSKRNPKPLGQAKVLWLESSSPSSKTSWTGLALDAHLLEHFGLGPVLRFFVNQFGDYRLQSLYKRVMMGKLEVEDGLPKGLPEKGKIWKVGQLATKIEAAGKVRVFALVDIWTQSVLRPLHLWLFDFLKSLPNDATFDQHASVKRCMEKVKRHRQSFGFDLTAATDRLPIALQVSILSSFFGTEFASNWKALLVDRDYVMEDKQWGEHRLRYSVGQPMGALSSWAMLAVTHHLIVQYSALLAGKVLPGQWYTEYELLGDDIILFEKGVAAKYLSVMEGIGVGITLSKSVVSTNETIEFAKVTGHNGQNVSAVSWKMFMSQTSIMGRSNICYSLLNKDIVTSNYIAWFRDITRVSKKQMTTGYNYSLLAVLSMYVNSEKLPIGNLSRALTDVLNPTRQAYKNALSKLGVKRLEHLLVSVIKGLPLPEFESGNRFWWRDEMSLKGSISARVENFRLKFDIYQRFTGLAKVICSVISRDNLLFPVSETRDSVDLIQRAILEVLIEEWKDKLFKIILSTAALHGVPQYFMLRLSEKQVNELKDNPSTMDTFGRPLEWWISLEGDMDSLMGFGKIVERARKKASDTGTVAKNKYDSPLKPMKIFLKGRREWVLKMMGK